MSKDGKMNQDVAYAHNTEPTLKAGVKDENATRCYFSERNIVSFPQRYSV